LLYMVICNALYAFLSICRAILAIVEWTCCADSISVVITLNTTCALSGWQTGLTFRITCYTACTRFIVTTTA
jgi:hypothetical protein